MLDINDFIKDRGGNPEKIKESQRRRGEPEEAVDKVISMFEEARAARYSVSQISTTINAKQKEIGAAKKAKLDAEQLLADKKILEENKKAGEALAIEKEVALQILLKKVGNYVADNVPVSQTEDDNVTERTWEPENFDPTIKEKASHHEILLRLNGYDPVRGVKLVGHRGYCLTGMGTFLNLALINYSLEFLYNKGYTPNQPPFFLNKDMMAKTAQLSQFDEELYKVSEGVVDNEDNAKYLIATSEQPLTCLHSGEWLQPAQLPIKYAGYSTCFRKEAGSHGRDAWGIFRVHQFEKVEQLILCNPEESWKHFDDMIETSEEFYKSLKLPYRVVSIVSGALNSAAAKKYDLEAWFPFQQEYKELVSCSNCLDYQSRPLEIRHGSKKGKGGVTFGTDPKPFVHMLNATLCATTRTLCCILENYQTEEGLRVPEVLRRYIPGQPEFIPFPQAEPKVDPAVASVTTNLPAR